MQSMIEQLQDKILGVRDDINYEIEVFSHSDEKEELLKQAVFRLKQAWYLLDEAAELQGGNNDRDSW